MKAPPALSPSAPSPSAPPPSAPPPSAPPPSAPPPFAPLRSAHPSLPASLFEAIVDLTVDAVISVDESQRIVLFNRGAEVIFGYGAAELLGQPLSVLLPESARSTHHEHVSAFGAADVTARAMSERRPVSGRRKDGALIPIDVSISQVTIDGHAFYTAVLRDVTDRFRLALEGQAVLDLERDARARAERATARSALLGRASNLLDLSLARTETLAALARLCVPGFASVCIIDTVVDDGTIRRVVAGRDAAGGDLPDEIARAPTDQAPRFITRPSLLEGRRILVPTVSDADLIALARDERHLALWRRIAPTSYICAPFRAGDRIIGAIALAATSDHRPFDAADLPLLGEIASRASLAMENARLYDLALHATALRDDMLAIVSHDLRNPLATMSLAVARLEEEPALTRERRAALLALVHDSADWMARMIRDLLDVASIDAGRLSVELATADLVILLVRAAALFEQAFGDRGIDLVLEVPDRLPRVAIDEERILQLVGNLLSNAAKFTPAGGRVTLAARHVGREIVVSVRDTGRGIPPGDVPLLFDRYWSARRGAEARSTGLGLSIAQGIVVAHGGRIWVDTTEGAGSEFSFTLPC